MRVLFAYTPEKVRPEALDALTAHAPHAELVDVSGDQYAYWGAICARWDGLQDLVTVEHDIEIYDDVLPGFAECPGQWCTFPYQLTGGKVLDRGLGCTRFSAAVQRAIAPARVTAMPAADCDTCRRDRRPGCWLHLDGQIASAMEHHLGYRRPCVHYPPVTHHHT